MFYTQLHFLFPSPEGVTFLGIVFTHLSCFTHVLLAARMWLYLFTCSKLSFSPSLSVYDVKSEFLIPFLLFPSWYYISRNQTHLDSISRKCISYPHYFNFLLLTWPCLKCWNNVVLFVKSYFCLTVLNLYHFTLCFSVSFCGIRVFMWNTIYNCHTIYPSICGTTSIILSMVYHLSVYFCGVLSTYIFVCLCTSFLSVFACVR